MDRYELAAIRRGHEDDVVAWLDRSTVVSASRDGTVRTWSLGDETECDILFQGRSFVNAVTAQPPSLVVSGGKDAVIDVRNRSRRCQDDADALLTGHAHNVCALDVDPEGKWVVSGSWDSTARVWSLGSYACHAVLEGHEGSVWAVLARTDCVITGCADRVIRVFDYNGKVKSRIKGSTDVVRALCSLSASHASGADFASAGNDAVIRLWRLDGQMLGELHGHESFIYAIAATSTGELVSAGEDRSVRVWRGSECVQTIIHPAISVWSIAVCTETGDIASGASDSIVRIFTRDKSRCAPIAVRQAHQDAVKASAVPQQTLPQVDKEQLPGPDFLQRKSGTKDGQVQMIREPNGKVSAHQWSSSLQSWTNVGTVVDSAGSTGKKVSFQGKDYDYVFDVDIEDGQPPLKLPYNTSENPYDTATKFIQNHELPMSYLDQVANFIITNAQGANIGPQSHSSGSDAWGTGSRYRPDSESPKILPQRTYLLIKSANLPLILRKLHEFNAQLMRESNDAALDAQSMDTLQALKVETLGNSSPCIPQLCRMLKRWPTGLRLPVIDLARLLAAAMSEASSPEMYDAICLGAFEDADRPNSIMMAMRTFGNYFAFSEGRKRMAKTFDQIIDLATPHRQSQDRNMSIAIATLFVNYAVLLVDQKDVKHASTLLREIVRLLGSSGDSETVYRAMIAAGTLLDLGEELHLLALGSHDLVTVAGQAQIRCDEPRIASVLAEMRHLLKDYT